MNKSQKSVKNSPKPSSKKEENEEPVNEQKTEQKTEVTPSKKSDKKTPKQENTEEPTTEQNTEQKEDVKEEKPKKKLFMSESDRLKLKNEKLAIKTSYMTKGYSDKLSTYLSNIPVKYRKTGLTLSVKMFKKFMLDYFALESQVCKPSLKVSTQDIKKRTIQDYDAGLVVVSEELIKKIINDARQKTTASETGLYIVKTDHIEDVIREDNDLDTLFGRYLANYKKNGGENRVHDGNFCIPKEQIEYLFETTFPYNIMLDGKAFNLLVYVLAELLGKILKTTLIIKEYVKKWSLEINVLKYTLKTFEIGELLTTLIQQINNLQMKMKDPNSKNATEEEEKHEEKHGDTDKNKKAKETDNEEEGEEGDEEEEEEEEGEEGEEEGEEEEEEEEEDN